MAAHPSIGVRSTSRDSSAEHGITPSADVFSRRFGVASSFFPPKFIIGSGIVDDCPEVPFEETGNSAAPPHNRIAEVYEAFATILLKMWPAPGEPSSVSTAAIAKDYEELTKAALFNRAVIYTDLLHTAQRKQDEYQYALNAMEALNTYLEKWPNENDPQASEARNLLNSLNGSL